MAEEQWEARARRAEGRLDAAAAEITGHTVGCTCDDCSDFRREGLVSWIENAKHRLDAAAKACREEERARG